MTEADRHSDLPPIGRLVFTMTEEGYAFSAPTRFDRIFAGVHTELPESWKRDDESILSLMREMGTPNDCDYGRLLRNLDLDNGGSSPTGFEPVFWP